MSNKFLGLDSVNVLKEYIDGQINTSRNSTRVATVQAYAYVTDADAGVNGPSSPSVPPVPPETFVPNSEYGSIDDNGKIHYPNGWNSLNNVLISLRGIDENAYQENIESALREGSIYMTAGVLEGGYYFNKWSTPVKISGQNGVGIQFKYTYNEGANPNVNLEELSDHPNGVNSNNRVEYVWTKYGDDVWEGPFIWAMYSTDASDVHWRYLVTSEEDEFGNPVIPNKPSINSLWTNTIPTTNISSTHPYMWMSWQRTPAGQNVDNDNWSDPILFGHYGQDGNVPDYTFTLYAVGSVTEAPIKPEFQESENTTDFKLRVGDVWKTIPEETGDVWYQCTIEVNGLNSYITNIGEVKRYSAVDGTALPGQFTKYLYKWSDTQESPDFVVEENEWKPTDWNERPDIDVIDNPEASLWMISAVINGYDTDTATPIIENDWSNPVKISGPRGPISYDYRIETRYNIGTSEKPKALPTEEEWNKYVPAVTTKYPYIWAINYLMCYTMGYDENNKIVAIDNGTLVDSYNYFRLSGIDGEDGNRKNSLKYSNTQDTIEVESFSEHNLYISNSDENVTYEIRLDPLSFINGYTGKFANIGNGTMTINAYKDTNNNYLYKFIGSGTEATSITLNPQESIELVCYNNGSNKELLVIGKSLDTQE